MMFEQLHAEEWNYPYGRGVNFSITTANIDGLYQRLLAYDHPLYRLLMVNSYEADGSMIIQKEFLVQDPDTF